MANKLFFHTPSRFRLFPCLPLPNQPLVILGLILFLLLGISNQCSYAEATPPKIEVIAPIFDFGTVIEGTRVTHDFEVLNAGGTDLIIQQVVPACGCTAAVAKDSTVLPGAKTVIHVAFDSTGFSGEKTKAARINSNDPENPSTFITLKGIVENDLTIEPARIMFDEFVVTPETPLPEVSVSIKSKGSAQILSVMPGSPSLEIQNNITQHDQSRFIVKPKQGVAPGDIRDRVVVEIERSGQKREISIPVIGKAVGPVSLKPSSLAMGIIDGTEPVERRVQLENKRGKAFSIAKIESDNVAVTVSEKGIEQGKVSVLVVVVDPKLLKGDLRSTVTITFNDSALSPLQFSVYGVRPPTLD